MTRAGVKLAGELSAVPSANAPARGARPVLGSIAACLTALYLFLARP
jgi:hypothetical protein